MNTEIPQYALDICLTLKRNGFEAYLVGGAVRDSILGLAPNDWDIATNARPEQVTPLFDRVIETGIQHGTVTVVTGSKPCEVTTYRADGDYSDGRRPDSVRFVSSIEQDLARRDFTVNAIAFDPISGRFVDPFGGAYDIALGVIRTVGDPRDRFSEDTLRTLRAVRFAATLGFAVDSSTLREIARHPLRVAHERIRVELEKGLLSNRPSVFMSLLLESGLLEQVLPELRPSVGCEQNKYHEYDVWNHTTRVIHSTPPDLALRFAAMLHDVAKPTVKGVHPVTGEATFYDHEKVGAEVADNILRRLKFSNEDRERIVHLVRCHLVPDLKSPSAIRRWVRKVGRENVDSIIALAKADCAGKGNPREPGTPVGYLDNLLEKISNMPPEQMVERASQLAISGNDVMVTLGISPGPVVGQELKRLLDLVTDEPDLNNRETLIRLLSER